MVQVYNYDASGWFIGATNAHHDPLENPKKLLEGRWLLPARATFVAPPKAKEGQRAKFVGDKWELHTDPSILTPEQKAAADKKAKSDALIAAASEQLDKIYSGFTSPVRDAGALALQMQQLMYVAQNMTGAQSAAEIDNAKKQLAALNTAAQKADAVKKKLAADLAAL